MNLVLDKQKWIFKLWITFSVNWVKNTKETVTDLVKDIGDWTLGAGESIVKFANNAVEYLKKKGCDKFPVCRETVKKLNKCKNKVFPHQFEYKSVVAAFQNEINDIKKNFQVLLSNQNGVMINGVMTNDFILRLRYWLKKIYQKVTEFTNCATDGIFGGKYIGAISLSISVTGGKLFDHEYLWKVLKVTMLLGKSFTQKAQKRKHF